MSSTWSEHDEQQNPFASATSSRVFEIEFFQVPSAATSALLEPSAVMGCPAMLDAHESSVMRPS